MSRRLLLALLVPLHLAAAWWWLGSGVVGFPVDDTWIHLVYARALAAFDGFAYNPGDQQVGVSAPLWTLLLSLPVGISEALGARPDLGVRLLGALTGLGAAYAGARLAARAGTWPAAFVAVALSLDPWMIYERFAGLEAPLFAWLLLLYLGALADHLPRRAGLLGAALLLTRPEALVLVALGAWWLRSREQPSGRFLIIALGLTLPWLAWCFIVSGLPWPSTFGSKITGPDGLVGPWQSLLALIADSGWTWSLPLLAGCGVVTLDGGRHGMGKLVFASCSALLLGVLLSRALPVAPETGRVPYYWARYALLAWPVALVLTAAGTASLVRTAWAGLRCRPLMGAALLAPLVIGAALATPLIPLVRELPARFAAECAELETLHVSAGLWIDEHLPPDAVVAVHDAGALRYFGRRTTLDVWGNHAHELNSVVRDGGDQAALQWLAAKRPDALAVFPLLYTPRHAPELNRHLEARRLTRAQVDGLLINSVDYADLFGLTTRLADFHVETALVIPGPVHADLAIFGRP